MEHKERNKQLEAGSISTPDIIWIGRWCILWQIRVNFYHHGPYGWHPTADEGVACPFPASGQETMAYVQPGCNAPMPKLKMSRISDINEPIQMREDRML